MLSARWATPVLLEASRCPSANDCPTQLDKNEFKPLRDQLWEAVTINWLWLATG